MLEIELLKEYLVSGNFFISITDSVTSATNQIGDSVFVKKK